MNRASIKPLDTWNCDDLVAGVDEAGRGPLAGPVVAAAVILPASCELEGLDDSKRLTPKRRAHLDELIRRQAVCWALGESNVTEIDMLNILQATLLAMRRAVQSLTRRPKLALVDGCHAPNIDCQVHTVIKGDAKVPAIAAASVLAKVHRDRMMITLDSQYPGYDFAANKGYPTPGHLWALKLHGASDIHRRSFAPVRAAAHCGKVKDSGR